MVCPSGREGNSSVSGTVCLKTCSQCNGKYIGETGKPLLVSVKVHVDGLDNCKVSTPLEHRLRSHSGAVIGIAVTILASEFDIAAPKALKALWIAFKNSTINRRGERVAVTHELAPFAFLCGLDPGGRKMEPALGLPGEDARRRAAEGLTQRESSFTKSFSI
ncbi:unnamed protein product [Heligmosomoides polygyrus]|uniref:Uncharacterized protein n=1 Tax=Heligmosomoides polygyrus TaxID=6339 RepID=A0A183GLR3_HELPZ|nr:unnamed protein product [Heligmosomoides polygyrus]